MTPKDAIPAAAFEQMCKSAGRRSGRNPRGTRPAWRDKVLAAQPPAPPAVSPKLARELLAGAVAAGDTVRVRYDREAGVVVEKQVPSAVEG